MGFSLILQISVLTNILMNNSFMFNNMLIIMNNTFKLLLNVWDIGHIRKLDKLDVVFSNTTRWNGVQEIFQVGMMGKTFLTKMQ